MNNIDFYRWNREAILQAALEYRDSSERWRIEAIHTKTTLARVTAERDRLREALEKIETHPNADFNVAIVPKGSPTIAGIARAALQEEENGD